MIANLLIVHIEYQNHTASGGWLSVLPKTAIPTVVSAFFLFHAFNGATHWLFAWLMFAVGMMGLRLVLIYAWEGHQVERWDYVTMGVLLVLVGALLIRRGSS